MPNYKLPAVCDVSVTNVCNGAYDFCGFARETLAGTSHYLDADTFARTADPAPARHPVYDAAGGRAARAYWHWRLVSEVGAAGISCAIITIGWFLSRYIDTIGWFLSRYIDQLAAAGLDRLIISIDSADLAEHECNRSLEGLERRIAEGMARARKNGLPVQASVSVNRLVRFEELPDTLRRLEFDDSPSRILGTNSSASLRWSTVKTRASSISTATSCLLRFGAIDRLRKRFSVVNPRSSLAEVGRYVRGEPQAVPCIGGCKYFYIDWNLDIWRSEAWNEPLGSVFDRIPDQREPCNACMMGCYRNASMLMHAAVAATDAARMLGAGQVSAAMASLSRRSVAQSLWALIEETPKMRRLARRRKRAAAVLPDDQPANCKAEAF